MLQPSATSDLRPGFLKCSVSKGMFPDEYAIEITVEGNKKASLFAAESDLEEVDINNHTGLLKVKWSMEHPSHIILPSTTLEQGNSVVNVPQGMLVTTR